MDATSVSQDHARAEDQPKPREPIATHRGGGTWSLLLFITPVIYVLSIGPVFKIDQALYLSQKAPGLEHILETLETVYSPLIWCAKRSRPLERALAWYLFSVWKLKLDI